MNERQRTVDALVDIDVHGFVRVLPRKGPQAVDNADNAVERGRVHRVEALQRRDHRSCTDRKIGVALQRAERGVDLVGNAGQKLPERGHLLRLRKERPCRLELVFGIALLLRFAHGVVRVPSPPTPEIRSASFLIRVTSVFNTPSMICE